VEPGETGREEEELALIKNYQPDYFSKEQMLVLKQAAQ
jgi:hypothetical protein